MGISVGIYQQIFGVPPDRTMVERIEGLEKLNKDEIKPLVQDDFDKLFNFRTEALKVGEDNSNLLEYRNLISKVERIFKREIDWFDDLSKKSVETFSLEQVEQLNGFEKRYSVFPPNDSISKYAQPVIDTLRSKSSALKFQGLRALAQSLMGSVNGTEFEKYDELKGRLENVSKDLKQVAENKEFNREALSLSKSVDEAAERIGRLKLAGAKPKNGGQSAVSDYLRENLNDFDSSEYLAWSEPAIVDVGGQPFWMVKLRLRAKNMFGGYIVKTVTFYIIQDKVVVADGL